MKKLLYITEIVLWSAFAFLACEEVDVDNEKPVILIIAPTDDKAVAPGSAIYFEVEFSDNEALASYKVDIHGAFDNHTHNVTELSGIITRATTDSVAFEKTWRESDFLALGETPIAGRKQATVTHQHIVIPENVNGKPLREGHYHFIVYCTDQSGQESFVAQEIFVSY